MNCTLPFVRCKFVASSLSWIYNVIASIINQLAAKNVQTYSKTVKWNRSRGRQRLIANPLSSYRIGKLSSVIQVSSSFVVASNESDSIWGQNDITQSNTFLDRTFLIGINTYRNHPTSISSVSKSNIFSISIKAACIILEG